MTPDGTRRLFSEYAMARGELIRRMGEYCSFCESKINASLAVEHVLPKIHHPERKLDWNNFLLACVNCNSTKGDDDLQLEDYFWPDSDNTARAFAYSEDGLVGLAPDLTAAQTRIAKRTIKLTGLDKTPTHDPAASDRRWMHRLDAWGRAREAREDLSKSDNEITRRLIVNQATALGFWSIWMTVFASDLDMRQRFITAFVGTPSSCFDAQTQPVQRQGGAL
ncbi:HNH endonuclease [Archangium sp.]|uniref:HNH endonuclease n=1 Tax=Archangium sp. TaxID=1872627 RepID=UPI002D412095|nr:HNH endonuclease [Archangium sp.]HYO51479.1 HNH endonuclease [Archangium sp.]